METLLKIIENQSKLTLKYHSIIGDYQRILNFLIDVDAIREPSLGFIKEEMAHVKAEYEQASEQILNL